MIIKPKNILDHFSKDYEYQRILSKKISYNRSEDLLQEAYIKLYNRFTRNNKEYDHNSISGDRMYIYLTMMSINTDFYRTKKNKPHDELNDNMTIEDDDSLKDKQVLEYRLEEITKLLNTLHWYDKKLFEIYLYSGKSMKTISDETKISVTSIFKTIKEVKNKIKNKVT